jgi:hypothetical protein
MNRNQEEKRTSFIKSFLQHIPVQTIKNDNNCSNSALTCSRNVDIHSNRDSTQKRPFIDLNDDQQNVMRVFV